MVFHRSIRLPLESDSLRLELGKLEFSLHKTFRKCNSGVKYLAWIFMIDPMPYLHDIELS